MAEDGPGGKAGPVLSGLEVFRIGGAVSQVAIFSFPLEPAKVPGSLSRAEADIALMLDRGLSRAEIAHARGRSLATVNNQIRSLYGKLRVGSRGKLSFALRGQR